MRCCSGLSIGACISEHLCDLHRNPVGRYDQGRIQMHVPLRDAVRGMAKQTRNRKFGKAKVARNAGEGMAEHMRGHVLEFRLSANTVEYPDDANEMPVAPVGRKDEGRTRTRRAGLRCSPSQLLQALGPVRRSWCRESECSGRSD